MLLVAQKIHLQAWRAYLIFKYILIPNIFLTTLKMNKCQRLYLSEKNVNQKILEKRKEIMRTLSQTLKYEPRGQIMIIDPNSIAFERGWLENFGSEILFQKYFLIVYMR